MKSSLHKKRHFFTLLEVLVSMGVFTILMLALMQFFSAAQTVWEKTGSRTETYESARLAVQLLKQDLANAFYGDPDHDMSSLRFFQYTAATNQKNLTFATERDGVLTEVDYCWASESDAADSACTLAISSIKGDTINVDTISHWVTKNNTWIGEIRAAPHTEVLRNVLFFEVKSQRWTAADTLSILAAPDAADTRPPAVVYITIGVISDDALEKIGRMAATPVTDLSNVENRKKAFTQARIYFNEIFDANGLFKKDALNDGEDNLPQRRIVFDGIQFFNILIRIDR